MEGAQFAGFSLDTSTGFLSHWTAVGRISAGENHKSYHKSNSTPLHQSCPEWQMVQVRVIYLIWTHSLVSCRGPCSAAVCSTDTGSDGVYWWYILQTRGTCTPDSSWCCAWRNPYSPHSSLLHNDDLNTHTMTNRTNATIYKCLSPASLRSTQVCVCVCVSCTWGLISTNYTILHWRLHSTLFWALRHKLKNKTL